MKKVLTTLALACFTLISFAQNIPAGIRMEVAEFEMNQNEYSVFTYKDADGTYGYYLSLGRAYNLLESSRDGVVTSSLDHVDETCILIGENSDEAMATLDELLGLLSKAPGTTLEFPCRLTTGADRLGEASTATCRVVKRALEGKRLNFQFQTGRRTAEADLTKSAIKSLKLNFKINIKLHPNGY